MTTRVLSAFAFSTCFLILATAIPGCSEAESEEDAANRIKRTILLYMMARGHVGGDVEKQLFPDINPTQYNPRDSMLYFSLKEELCDTATRAKVMQVYLENPGRIEWNWRRDSILALGSVRRKLSPEIGCVCRTHLENMKVDMTKSLEFSYPDATYTISLPELASFLENKVLYGGEDLSAYVIRYLRKPGFFNYGYLVAHPEEPSLTRLVEELLASVPDKREDRIQTLLDFVNRDIALELEKKSRQEAPKRPNEILMYGKSDVENKAVLFASLLEQIDEEYIIVYTSHQIAIAVPQGDFEDENQLSFEWDGTVWLPCAASSAGFRIGRDHIPGFFTWDEITQVQHPEQEGILIDPHTGSVIKK